MQEYYCVVTTIDDEFGGSANIVDRVMAERKPENTFVSTRHKDIYVDWYESFEEADATKSFL